LIVRSMATRSLGVKSLRTAFKQRRPK
jgi:hypothetical protein